MTNQLPGLHFDDINKLLAAFRALIEAGGSLLVIEHNLDVIKTADYVIDLGAEGGDAGGYVVGVGTPEEIMNLRGSYTGAFLQRLPRQVKRTCKAKQQWKGQVVALRLKIDRTEQAR